MKWLRYVVIALVIIILLIFFVAPFSLGWWTKSQLPKWVYQFNQNNPGVTVALDNYHRGFFHSTGNLHVSVADLNIQQALGLSDKHDTVDIDLAITQGPIVMTRISGKGTTTCLSNLPGRNKAGSNTSGLFVAAITMTPSFPSNPSISTSN